MSMRSYQRQIAKARMAALGIDKINSRMSADGPKGKNWRRVLDGDLAGAAESAQTGKQQKKHRRIRRIRKDGETR